jgi:hypothetical protein
MDVKNARHQKPLPERGHWKPWEEARPIAVLRPAERRFVMEVLGAPVVPERQKTLPNTPVHHVVFSCGHGSDFSASRPYIDDLVYCRSCTEYRTVTNGRRRWR